MKLTSSDAVKGLQKPKYKKERENRIKGEKERGAGVAGREVVLGETSTISQDTG